MLVCSGAERTAEGADAPLAARLWVTALRPLELTVELDTEPEYVDRLMLTSAPICVLREELVGAEDPGELTLLT